MKEDKFSEAMSMLMKCDISDIDIMNEVSELFCCVECFAMEMKIRLLDKYNQGQSGWDDEGAMEEYANNDDTTLQERIKQNIDTGEPIDVANLAMFWWILNGRKKKIEETKNDAN